MAKKQPTRKLPTIGAKVSKATIKQQLREAIQEEKETIKIEMALARENVQQALGVGNYNNWEECYNREYESVIKIKPRGAIVPRKLKTISSRKPKGIL